MQKDTFKGKMEALSGKIQKAYGKSKEEAQKEVKDFEKHSSSRDRGV